MTGARFEIVAYGVDDVTLGFDMSGSGGSVKRLKELPGVATRAGKALGENTSWGAWSNLLGRSYAVWRAETSRLYVQAKLAPENELCAPESLRDEVARLSLRMALIGLESFEEPWVTRVDIAADARCDPVDGKLLLDALEAARLPNGWRTTWAGVPRSTVYFRARASEKVVARAYCRNLKRRTGKPFGLIRLEASQRYKPREVLLSRVTEDFLAGLWRTRYCGLAGRVIRLPRERQALELGRMVERGELRPAAAERMSLFLDLEALGVAETSYPLQTYKARRREAVKLGLSANEIGREPLEVELTELLDPYVTRTVGVAA